MNNSWYFILFLCLCFIGFSSCGGDDAPANTCQWTLEIQDEATALQNASAVWSSDPSDANCNALKSAYQSYINALRPYSCGGAGWEAALQEAEDDLANVC